jgi:hypothetical protein
LGGGRDLHPLLEVGRARGQTPHAALAGQDLGLDQGPDTFLEEERVPIGPRDQQSLERLEGPIVPEQGVEQLLCALR